MTAHHLVQTTGHIIGALWRLALITLAVLAMAGAAALMGVGGWTIWQIASVS